MAIKMMRLKDKKVIVAGTGKSGIGSAALLEKNGALPVIYDGNEQRGSKKTYRGKAWV